MSPFLSCLEQSTKRRSVPCGRRPLAPRKNSNFAIRSRKRVENWHLDLISVGLFSRPKAESTATLLRNYRSVATKVSFGVICVVRALPLMSALRPKRPTATTTSDF
jgi:hypothetical protein